MIRSEFSKATNPAVPTFKECPVQHTRFLGLSLISIAVATALGACGGSSGTDTGSGPSAQALPITSTSASGTVFGSVTGFGSIVVDGVHYEDNAASVTREAATGSKPSEARLGQRVRLSLGEDGSARSIEVMPELEGQITSIDTANQRFVVNGLTVTINSDSAAGPLTVFSDGYTAFASLSVNDRVEIHGLPRADTAVGAPANSYVIQATRIEKKTDPLLQLRASGFIQNLVTTGNVTTFKLGTLNVTATSVTPKPAGAILANGSYVSVLTTSAVTSNAMTATAIRVIDRRKDATPNEIVRLASKIASYDAVAGTFTLDGVTVNAKAATLLPAGTALASGLYARASGKFDANGVLQATEVKLQDRDDSAPRAELKGTITSYVSLADFTVRGVPVDASTARLKDCGSGGLANGQFVEVKGAISLTSPKVKATELSCSDDARVPTGAVIEREGLASAIDLNAKTFKITPRQGPAINVAWTDATYFKEITAATLSGAKVEVEGALKPDGSIGARRIKLED